jgi:hypothetical protein
VPSRNVASYDKDGDISIDFHHSGSDDDSNKNPASEEAQDQTSDEDDAVEDNLLFEPRLCKLFQSAKHSGKEQLEVLLESTPISAQLHSLHALPALSRSLLEKHPKIVEEIFEERANGSSGIDNKVLNQITEKTGKVDSTLFADVFVTCKERFWVKDVESGAIVQGIGDGKIREVVHTVRLERVSTYVPGQGRRLGDWLITDVDDLLEGNRWFTPPARAWWLTD